MIKKQILYFWVLILGFLIGFFNTLHVILLSFKTPPGKMFMGVGHFFLDYYNYLSMIAEGSRGDWQITTQMTTERFPRYWAIYWPYLLIGKIGKFFSLSAVSSYWLSVFILSVLVIWFSYYLISMICESKSHLIISVFLIFLTASPFFKLISLIPLEMKVYEISWYLQAPIFSRLTVIPHHLLASISVIGVFVFSSSFFAYLTGWLEDKKQPQSSKSFLMIVACFLLLGSLFPLRIVYLAPGFALSLLFILVRSQTKDKRKIFKVLGYIFLLAVILGLEGAVVKTNIEGIYSPDMVRWETNAMEFPPLKIFILGSGPVLILAFLTIFYFIKKVFYAAKSIQPTLFFGLVSSAISYILFYTKISLIFKNHNSRFLFPEAYLFMAILIIWVWEKNFSAPFRRKKMIVCFLVLGFCLFSILPLKDFLTERLNPPLSDSHYQYLDQGIIAGLEFVGKQKGKKIILGAPKSDFGLLVPVFADSFSFVGRWLLTVDYNRKLNEANLFFRGNWDLATKKDFLVRNKIDYLLWSQLDVLKEKPEEFISPPFITSGLPVKLVFSNSQINIYRVLP